MTKYFTTAVGAFRQTSELKDWWMPYPDQIKRYLSLLDGVEDFAFILWPGPDNAEEVGLDMDVYPITLLQCAGTKDRMTIEWKTNRDGVFRQYTLGRGGERSAEPTEPIVFNGGESTVLVYEDEVFGLEEAAEIFYSYFLNDVPPVTYVLRDLGLDLGPDGKGVSS